MKNRRSVIRSSARKPAVAGGKAPGKRPLAGDGWGRNPLRIDLISQSAEETQRIGFQIARELPEPGVLLLRGSLGSGKTTLTRGVAEGLGLEAASQVNSPSYTLVNIYDGRCRIYHVDLYRLSGKRDIRTVGLEEFMGQDGVTIIEWSERLDNPPVGAIEVDIEDAGENRRRIRIGSRKSARKPKSGSGIQRIAPKRRH